MQTEEFMVLNVKCEGCAGAINDALKEISGIDSVTVHIDEGKVVLSGTSIERSKISAQLTRLGYPEIT